MYHYCTYFDRNYLTRGVALYRSLEEHCQQPFVLWVLCFDGETHRVLSLLNFPHVRLISVEEFEADDEALTAAKRGRTHVEYYWTCTPSLPLYLLRTHPEIDLITYLDADLFFYDDPQAIFDELGRDSILMFAHRYPAAYMRWEETSGIYNVGFLSFRRDESGMACLAWWRQQCLRWCYARKENGLYGDQKYLEEWPTRFKGVVVAQYKGAGVAPWNMSNYGIRRKSFGISVDNVPLIFVHFHSLRMIHPYACQPNSTFAYEARALVLIHMPYFACMRQAERTVAGIIQVQTFENPGLSRMQVMGQSVKEGWLYLGSTLSAVVLWSLGQYLRRTECLLDEAYAVFSKGEYRSALCLIGKVLVRNPFLLWRPGVAAMMVKGIGGCVRLTMVM
jgi:hypothetical protein